MDEDLELTDKQLEIMDYITEHLAQAADDAKDALSTKVEVKFGTDGVEMWRLMMDDSEMDDEIFDDDCPECGKISDEWLEDTRKKMQLFDVFTDDSFDEFVSQALEDKQKGIKLNCEYFNDMFDDNADEWKSVIDIVKKKILFDGIINGWLIEEYYE